MDSAAQGKLRVAINGFGRIGRNAFKVALEDHEDELEIVAINDLTEPKVLAHLLEYDTAYGKWGKEVSSDEHSIIVDGNHYQILAEKEPAKLPWKDLNIDVVIESTGRFTDEEGLKQHLTAGAKKVVLSAPAKGDGIGTFLIGVNDEKYGNEQLINNGSCTTNCIAPVAAIIHSKFGILKALMTTVHSVTAEQNLVDGPPPGEKHGDLRRARAAYANMIPTTSGAAVAVTQAIPELKGLFDGQAIRVPTIVGSISDFTFLLSKKTTLEEVKQAIKDACETPKWKGIVAWSEDPLVSSDIIGRSESAIVDLPLTQLVDGDLLKVFAWYDNEWGYSNRLIEIVIKVGKSGSSAPPPAPTPPTETKPPASEPTLPASPAPSYTASAKPDLTPAKSDLAPAVVTRPNTNDHNPLTLPPLPSTAPTHQPATFFAHPDLSAASTESTLPPESAPGLSEPVLPPPNSNSAPNLPVAAPVSTPPLSGTSLPLTPVAPAAGVNSPTQTDNLAPALNAAPAAAHAELASALNMPGSTPAPAKSEPAPAPAEQKDGKPKEPEPKIEDHALPEGAPAPKNNPFLNWFK